MEIVGPANLLYALVTHRNQVVDLPIINKLVAALYLTHYTNRAIVSPFFVAPSMSPIHLFVVASAVTFNWFNSSCIAGWVLGYPAPVEGYTTVGSSTSKASILPTVLPYIGTILFALGMFINIRAERTLFRFRREEAEKRSSSSSPKEKSPYTATSGGSSKYSKVYVIPPPTGLFRTILYPHYVGEWLEWIGFALVGAALYPSLSFSPSYTSSYSALSSMGGTKFSTGGLPPLQLVPWLTPAAALADRLGLPLPLPAVVFVVNAVTNMLPHARWGRRWYVRTFGEKAVGGRGAVMPFFSWM